MPAKVTKWILYGILFEGTPVVDNSGQEGVCSEPEAGHRVSRGLYHDFELPLVDDTFSFTDTNRNPAVTWTVDVEVLGPMPMSDGS